MATRTIPVREGSTRNVFPWDDFMEREGIPVYRAEIGIPDVTKLPRAPWARTGGNGTFIELTGTFQSERGAYVADIPPNGELKPEKHLYEEEIFILSGQGVAQVWQGDGKRLTFEWSRGSVFTIPPNATHFLANTTSEPVVYMGVTTAPRVINALFDDSIVFNSDYQFVDLTASTDNYFLEPEVRSVKGWYKQGQIATHLIRNAHELVIDDQEQKVEGGQLTGYTMGDRFPRGHVSAWPTGRYHKAHCHGPGAILLGLDGEGYVLAWAAALGMRPYQDGHGDEVYKVEWGEHSIYSPPDRYYHQHFNTGAGHARHIAVYGEALPLGLHDLADQDGESWRGHKSVKEGGTLIEYQDEDPQVRIDFKALLAKNNLECVMSEVTYND